MFLRVFQENINVEKSVEESKKRLKILSFNNKSFLKIMDE